MASATLTLSQLSPNLKSVHVGINTAGGATQTAPSSASSILNICKLPNGATIVDFWASVANGGADQTFQMGTSSTPSGIMSVTTLSTTYTLSVGTAEEVNIVNKTIRAPGGTTGSVPNLMPIRISLSDDVQPSSVWIQGRFSVAASSSALVTVLFFYTMDGLAGRTTIR